MSGSVGEATSARSNDVPMGIWVGRAVGSKVGAVVGTAVGCALGLSLGLALGSSVGACSRISTSALASEYIVIVRQEGGKL